MLIHVKHGKFHYCMRECNLVVKRQSRRDQSFTRFTDFASKVSDNFGPSALGGNWKVCGWFAHGVYSVEEGSGVLILEFSGGMPVNSRRSVPTYASMHFHPDDNAPLWRISMDVGRYFDGSGLTPALPYLGIECRGNIVPDKSRNLDKLNISTVMLMPARSGGTTSVSVVPAPVRVLKGGKAPVSVEATDSTPLVVGTTVKAKRIIRINK